MRVLVVVDEVLLAGALVTGLETAGMTVDAVHDGLDATERLDVNAYDAVVLDRDVPGLHGDDVCRYITTHHPAVAVLMLTASARLGERVRGLELGADDYLAKPFEFPELIARLRALQRRSGPRTPLELRVGTLRLDPSARQAYRDDRLLALTPKEFRVLEQLLRAGGRVISAEDLLQKAWDEQANPFTNSPRVVVSSLRKKLGRPWPIETVPGFGYRVVAQPTERS
jgi:two-component system response regulator VanR